jgi:intracellular sulfur oxidation DsrE/DsrF family protein
MAEMSSLARRRFLSRAGATAAWLDQIPGVHRMFMDAPTAEGFGRALFFGNNVFGVNVNAYGLKDGDVALIICARHESTPFAFNDAMWAKYSEQFANQAVIKDPKTSQPAKVNMYMTQGYQMLPSRGMTLDRLLGRGLRLAVCMQATRGMSGQIARATSQSADDVYKELTSNLVHANAHMVPAGIVAVNRAQEHGYSFSFVA